MNKYPVTTAVIANLNQLDQLPFLKRQGHRWFRFKEKERFLPLFRNLSYQSKQVLSKIFVFNLNEQKKDNKKIRFLDILTQRQIINLQYLFQILNQNMDQRMFSEEVQRIKEFQLKLYRYVDSFLSKHLLKYKRKDYLSLNIYKVKEDFYIKGSFNDYNYCVQIIEETKREECPQPYQIKNELVKEALNKKYKQLQKMSQNLPFGSQIAQLYQKFYDKTYFHYDQYVLKLQVFNNYPMLRLRNYIPIKFQDFQTKEPLQGPIFSNSDPDCMYGHFLGYNANTIKLVEGKYCQDCQVLIQQLQQNELLMFLRDNILNPQKTDLYYNPEYNRFKLLTKKAITVEQEIGQMSEEKIFYKTILGFLNYYHFRINLKKFTNKIRPRFTPNKRQQSFPLTFNLNNQKLLIIDPARGKFCQHYAFTDLRLYYANYDPQKNLYKCPVAGCNETMMDGDIMYLKEVQILMEYAKFKCQECPQLVDCSQIVIEHNKQKVFVLYKIREKGVVLSKIDQLIDYYKTLVDPYVPFAEYSLGIKQKERKQRIQQYMFGGLREEMEKQQMQQDQEDQFYQES